MSRRPATLATVCETVWDMERAFGLLDLEIGGVQCWQAGRMAIFYEICEALGLYGTPHRRAAGRFGPLRRKLRYGWNAVAHNPFLARPGVDLLVVPHGRPKRVGGTLVDAYTADHVGRIQAEGRRVTVLEPAEMEGRLDAPRAGRRNPRSDVLLILDAVYRAARTSFPVPREAAARMDGAAAGLEAAFGKRFPLRERLVREAYRFRVRHRAWRMLLGHLRPKALLVVVGYGFTPLIGAARDAGIPVTEVQHGVISRYHMGYSYPGLERPLAYFPDRFLSWGSYWTQGDHFPLPEEAVTRIGFAHLRDTRASYADVRKVPGRVVVISQGVIGRELADLMWRNRDGLKGFDVQYKLHPGEYGTWRAYDGLVRLAGLPNVTVVKEADLYRMQAEAEFQIGVFSTAIYEGFAFNLKTVLCDLPGIEYMEALIERYRVPLVKDRNLGDLLRGGAVRPVPWGDFF